MNAPSLVFMTIAGLFLFVLPRRAAVIPVLLAIAYTTRFPVVELGPANLSVLRVLVLIGGVRILARGERIANGVNMVDRLLVLWAVMLIGLSLFHTSDAWTFRIGMVLGELGVYWLFRVFIQDADDVRYVFRTICVVLVPLAALMVLEKATAHNYFGVMGGPGEVNIREGHVRAYGPFGHSILAGTVGATCVPVALCLWRSDRAIAFMGFCAAAGIVFASTSSGPIMMVVFTMIGLLLWKVRTNLSLIRWGTVAALIALQIVMKDPVYFLMARIDITGGSTGWHRAQLVRSSIEHLNEWWLAGTDYTRHWMASGIHANEIHTDITNHFLGMGVLGGLPLIMVFVLAIRAGFRGVGRALEQNESRSTEHAFLIWTLGAMLFGQVMNFWSISLFDNSVSLFYLVLATVGAVHMSVGVAEKSLSNLPQRPRVESRIVRAPAAATVTTRDTSVRPSYAKRATPNPSERGLRRSYPSGLRQKQVEDRKRG